jgi:nicotinate-nucleotide adenylyltransferase
MTVIALLGGTFDPVHNGHLHLARQILRKGAADRVAFLPNNRHNFKGDKVILPYSVRFELIAAVLEEGMELWDDDREGSGYTSDLLRRLYKLHPETRLPFVIGSDNLESVSRWHDFPWLRDNAEFLVIPRPGYPAATVSIPGVRASVLAAEPSGVSSTGVRERLRRGLPITGLVPAAIEDKVAMLYRRAWGI